MRSSVLLLLGALLSAVAAAPLRAAVTPLVRYVDTGSAGGDGTTAAVAGAQAAYVSLAALESAEDGVLGNLVAYGGGDGARLTIYIARTNGGGVDTAQGLFDDAEWTTDATHDIEIIGVGARTGVWSASAPTFHNNNGLSSSIFAGVSALTVRRLQFQVTASTSSRYGIVVTGLAAGAGTVTVCDCLFAGTCSGTGAAAALQLNDARQTLTVVNCAAWGFRSGSDTGFLAFTCVGGVGNFYNCIAWNSLYGIRRTGGTVSTANSIFGLNADNLNGTITADYCCTDSTDGGEHRTSPNGGDWALEVTDAANGDFRLLATATGCRDNGTADPGGASQPNTDIIGTARPQGSGWDRGIFEYVAPATTKRGQWLSRPRALHPGSTGGMP